MDQRRRIPRLIVAMAVIWAGLVSGAGAQETETVDAYPMVFPIAGNAHYVDTFGAARSEGRSHAGTDIFAQKGTPVVAVAPGTVVRITVGERAGRYIVVEHDDGWRSYYLHLDNDTPGTDDGLGGAPADGIVLGARVDAGQVLDFVGDSGNAEGTPPHLHFELHDAAGTVLNPYPHLRAAETGDTVFTSAVAAVVREHGPDTLNTVVVGNLDPGSGFASGIAVHADVAYLGTWGRPEACPADGVRLIDVSDPERPEQLAAIASGDEFPDTSTDSVWVGAVDNTWFTGDLAVVAVRLCDNSERGRLRRGFRGIAIYDVTNPAKPKRLSKVGTGGVTQGAHEVDVAVRDDGSVVVAATVMQSLIHTDGRRGDIRIFDATNPRVARELADWDARRDGPMGLVGQAQSGRSEEELHAHGVRFTPDGTQLWAAHWDAGVALLDVSDATEPQFVNLAGIDRLSEGNAHAVVFDADNGLLIRSDEDLFPNETAKHVEGWGGQRLYRVTQAGKVTEIARFATADATDENGDARTDGYFTAHESVVSAGIEYAAWYSSGLRIVDVTDPRTPTEIGHFVPPPRRDPQDYWEAPDGSTNFAMVWGVEIVDDLIFVSDMNTGLWIVRFDDGLSEEMLGILAPSTLR